MTEKEMFSTFRTLLHTPVVGNVLNNVGRYHQFLPGAVPPMRETMKLIGRAMPVRLADLPGPQEEPFGKMPETLDQLREGMSSTQAFVNYGLL